MFQIESATDSDLMTLEPAYHGAIIVNNTANTVTIFHPAVQHISLILNISERSLVISSYLIILRCGHF